ncbi:TetR/AcrR family transcriptional regulator [Hoyosella subflava]|uniref:Transcriptional regulator, TetR family n=1 Tax=Hoyosella subflava (strain DSM 45089 / JCM 17490 / NBRC 109087 / DQS3-9A1) TaxID=443218 RepID=F6ERP7_HOYSD|nr:TetR/AcrR family transcriptional regulator [Hoyosella subflava]AEF39624.1 Transcriptional regulator, TetR family [Hoyosella subflava DQS3-9A1]
MPDTTVSGAQSASDTSEEVTSKILAAAQHEFELVGIQRSSVGVIARRAGIARATVYRRFPGKDTLVQAVAAREVLAVLARIAASVAEATDTGEAIVHLTVAGARELRSNALLNRLLTTEPEALYNYAANNGGSVLAVTRRFVVEYLESLGNPEQLRPSTELAIAAELMIRIATTQLLIPDGVIPLHDDDEVGEFARRYFVPLILPETTEAK